METRLFGGQMPQKNAENGDYSPQKNAENPKRRENLLGTALRALGLGRGWAITLNFFAILAFFPGE